MSLQSVYLGAKEIVDEEKAGALAAAKEEAAALEEARRSGRATWLNLSHTTELLDTLVKREQELFQKARDCRVDSANCRDLLAKSYMVREIIDYATTGNRSI